MIIYQHRFTSETIGENKFTAGSFREPTMNIREVFTTDHDMSPNENIYSMSVCLCKRVI